MPRKPKSSASKESRCTAKRHTEVLPSEVLPAEILPSARVDALAQGVRDVGVADDELSQRVTGDTAMRAEDDGLLPEKGNTAMASGQGKFPFF